MVLLLFQHAYIPNVKANYLSLEILVAECYLLSSIAQAVFQLRGQPEVDLLASSHHNQCQYYYTLENPLPLGALGLNVFNHPWTYQVRFMFPPALVPSDSVQVSGRTCQGQFSIVILVAPH